MIIRKSLLAACLLMTAAPAQASPALPPETISAIGAALSECTGGWYEAGGGRRLIGPAELAPRVALLASPSPRLDHDAGEDLYEIATALLLPAVTPPAWFTDRGASLKCPARPAEALALMRYLAGDEAEDLRGYNNILDWLGLAYESGVAAPADLDEARRYYLRSRIHSGHGPAAAWSDGIDEDVITNIERAGLRSYLEALAASGVRSSSGARMILAEEALATDPARARALLRSNSNLALNRLLELEEQGRVPTLSDPEDIAFWAEAWSTMLGFPKWAARLMKGVRLANGGTIPTASTRPAIDDLRPHLDTATVADASATIRPLPMRALVDPRGRTIYIEACREGEAPPTRTNGGERAVRMEAVRLFNIAGMPRLAPPTIDGRPAYGWVILPAVHFQRSADGQLEIGLVNLAAESCIHSDMDIPIPRAP